VESAPQPSDPADGASLVPGFAPDPAHGRLFTTGQVVRGTEVTPSGRLRLDALARYLQDAAEDDLADAGWDEPYGWLLRRCEVAVRGYPRRGQRVRVRTFCSGTGPRWAERTTTLSGPPGDLVQARALWVAVTREDGRPCPLGAQFHRIYVPALRQVRHTAGESRKSQALFSCAACGWACHADVNAAVNIAAGHAVTAREGVRDTGPVNREPQSATLPAA
jgi:hypothetical protein